MIKLFDLFELKEMTVSDAFLAAKIYVQNIYMENLDKAYPLPVNEQDIFIPGEHGKPATILCEWSRSFN